MRVTTQLLEEKRALLAQFKINKQKLSRRGKQTGKAGQGWAPGTHNIRRQTSTGLQTQGD